jgi:hypothetical protein
MCLGLMRARATFRIMMYRVFRTIARADRFYGEMMTFKAPVLAASPKVA